MLVNAPSIACAARACALSPQADLYKQRRFLPAAFHSLYPNPKDDDDNDDDEVIDNVVEVISTEDDEDDDTEPDASADDAN